MIGTKEKVKVRKAPREKGLKKAAGRSRRTAATRELSAEDRHRMIEQTAYLKAEENGFYGDPAQYWHTAEAEVTAMLAGHR